MKTTAIRRRKVNTRPCIPYPNAATRKEILHSALDALISAVCGAALATIVLFLMAVT